MAIHVDVRQAQATLSQMARRFTAEQIARATARAINHTTAKATTIAKRAILQKYNLHKSQVVGGVLKQKRATQNKQFGGINAYMKPIALSDFAGTHQTKAGVRVTVVRGEKKLLKGAFMRNSTNSGKRQVFARGQHTKGSGGQFVWRHKRIVKSGPDMPIEALYSTSIFTTGISEPTQLAMRNMVGSSYTSRLIKELDNIAQGITT